MKLIKPFFVFEDDVKGSEILKKLERYGRTCYKSEDKITIDSAHKFIAMILKNGHESVLEHEKITVRIICDRGVTHEIARHRIASYSQESTRFCNYKNKPLEMIEPFFFARDGKKKKIGIPWFANDGTMHLKKVEMNEFDLWFATMLFTEYAYQTLVGCFGRTPEEARSVLPHSLKTEMVVTYNLREWRHYFKLRCSKYSHPQMREITIPLLKEMKKMVPVIFDDIKEK